MNLNSPLNNQILVFNSTTLQWENVNQTAAAGTRTYTGLPPITVDNDNNLLGWNPGPSTDFNGTLDGFEGADLNFTVLDACLGDTNHVWTSPNNCQDITGFDIDTGGEPDLLRTYTGISPITADNDNNLLGLTVLPTSDWNGTFDGFDSNEFARLAVNNVFTADNNFQGVVDMNGFATGDALANEFDLIVGRAGAGSGGCILLGDYQICDTGNMGIVNDMNLDDMFIIRDMDGDTNIAFMFITPGTLPRFVIPREGPDFATNNTRSLILGGDIGQALDDDIILCSANGYGQIDCDTNATGADLGVQDDAQIRGTLFVDENVNIALDLNNNNLNSDANFYRGEFDFLFAQDGNIQTKGLLSVNPRYLDTNNGELNFDTNTQDLLHFFNGTFLETIDVDVNSNGTDVNLFMQKQGGGDLIIVFDDSDGFVFFDATPPATIELTVGSDTNPTLNYVFVPQSTNVLTVNTTGFPSNAEHAPVATVVVQSAASVVVDGAYKVHVWTDHSDDENTHQGHESHINSWIRTQPATWMDGVSQTLTITTNASRPDNVDFAVTSGTVLQLHDHAFPAFDTAVDSNIFVVNDSSTPFLKVNDLNALLTDSTGGSMSNRYFTLVVWGVVSEDSNDSKLMVNLPSGSYNKESDATDDVSGFDNFTIPVDFRGTGFLISKLVLRHQAASGGTWTSIQEGDLRGLFPPTGASGGSGSAVTSFSDNLFEIFNVTDSTKLLNFDLSDMATATTTTWTVPTRDINFAAPVFDDLNVLDDANFNKLESDFFFGDGTDLTGLLLQDGSRELTDNWTVGDQNMTFTNQAGLCFDGTCEQRLFSCAFNNICFEANASARFLTGGRTRWRLFATSITYGADSVNPTWELNFDVNGTDASILYDGDLNNFEFSEDINVMGGITADENISVDVNGSFCFSFDCSVFAMYDGNVLTIGGG